MSNQTIAARLPSGDARVVLALALLGAAVFLPGLGARDLWNPDEPRYAEVAREMAVSGDWLVPRFNGEIYTQKPPLLFWAINLAAALRGAFDETAVRLPSALAAIGTLLVVWWMGRRLFGRRAAVVAALVAAANFKVLWQARTAQIDMLLAFLVAASMACFLRGYLDERPGFYALYFLLAGLATLAKGPVGFLPPLLALLAFLWSSGRRDEIARLRPGRGVLLWAGVVALWLLAAAWRAGGEYLHELLFTQNLTRFLDPGSTPVMAGHLKPWYHYLTTLPVDFFPWSLALPAALWVPWREGSWRDRPGFRFAVCWLVVPLVFLSLSSAKRSVYLLPLFPALALLVAHFADVAAATWPRHRLATLLPLGLLAVIAGTAAALLPGRLAREPAAAVVGPDFALGVAALLAVIALGALGGVVLALARRAHLALALVAGATLLLGPIGLGALLPQADPLKSVRGVAGELTARLAPDEPFAIFPVEDGRTLFYTGRLATVLRDEAALRRWAVEGDGLWVVARRSDLAEIVAPLPYDEVVGDERTEGGIVLLRARRGAAEGP